MFVESSRDELRAPANSYLAGAHLYLIPCRPPSLARHAARVTNFGHRLGHRDRSENRDTLGSLPAAGEPLRHSRSRRITANLTTLESACRRRVTSTRRPAEENFGKVGPSPCGRRVTAARIPLRTPARESGSDGHRGPYWRSNPPGSRRRSERSSESTDVRGSSCREHRGPANSYLAGPHPCLTHRRCNPVNRYSVPGEQPPNSRHSKRRPGRVFRRGAATATVQLSLSWAGPPRRCPCRP